jgi:signal transduction histidine kinase
MTELDGERLERLMEVGRGLMGELDLDVVLHRVLEIACELTGARYAALGVLDERRQELARFVTRGVDEPTSRAIGDLPRGHGVLGTLIRDPRPLRLKDVGAHRDSWGFPSGHPPMTTFLGVPILVGGEAFGNLYLTEKRSGEFDEGDEETMLVLADWAAVAVANAEAHGRLRTRGDELERAVRSSEATMEIARAVGAETELDRVLELVVKRGRALVHARAMAILVQEGDEVVIAAVAGELDRSFLERRLPLAESVSGQVLATRRPQRLADPVSRLRSGLATAVDAKAGLYVPLLHRGQALGVLNAFDRLEGGPGFDAEDQRLMEAFAASAATAIATARNVAAETLRRSIDAAERERAHWARELHDETLQEFGALAIRLTAARAEGELERIQAQIDEALAELNTAADGLRGLITDLRPASLDQFGLEAALRTMGDRIQTLHELELELTIDLAYERGRRPTRLTPEIENVSYRLVQEALNNVVKHAGAQHVHVEVTEDERTVRVSVSDDGRGFTTTARHQGFGLLGMRERVALVDGSLEIESAPGKGTTLRAAVPVVHADRAQRG